MVILQDAKDRFFPYANATMKYHIYSLLEFYNDLQIGRNDGRFYDEKFVKILLTGVIGVKTLATIDSKNTNRLRKMDLTQGEININ